MPEIMLLSIIHQAMDQHGADGLWNGNGPCGCGRGDLAPCGGIQTDCVLAKSGTVREGEDDENNEVGGTVWYPMQVPSVAKESIPKADPAAVVGGSGPASCSTASGIKE
jgi:hypothetical protein